MVYLFLADGFEETEAIAPLDILLRAGVDIKTVGVTGEFVTGAHNITVKADIDINSVDKENTDAVILPGGLGGTENLDKNDKVKEIVRDTFNKGNLVCAICAAPSILGKMGLLNGKDATCYPGFEEYFNGGTYTGASVTKSGNIITSDGMGSAYKFGFEIVTALCGEKTAQEIKEQIQY